MDEIQEEEESTRNRQGKKKGKKDVLFVGSERDVENFIARIRLRLTAKHDVCLS